LDVQDKDPSNKFVYGAHQLMKNTKVRGHDMINLSVNLNEIQDSFHNEVLIGNKKIVIKSISSNENLENLNKSSRDLQS